MFLVALDKWFKVSFSSSESDDMVGDKTGNRSRSNSKTISSPLPVSSPQTDDMFKDICESISCQSHIFTSLPWMQQLLFYTIQRMNPTSREGFSAIASVVDEEGESISQLHAILIRLINRCSGNDVVSSIASICNQLESQREENMRLRAEIHSLKSTSDALPF